MACLCGTPQVTYTEGEAFVVGMAQFIVPKD
jgi:hypothetical protein